MPKKKKNKEARYTSLQDIRLARNRLRYEILLCEERMKNSSVRLFAGFTNSLRDFGFYVRNRLFTYAFFRSLSKSGMIYDFLTSFKKGFSKNL
ncbi:MAG: hypothetical protein EA408_13425 [Marinilabiliales bacterium]|nr:MAG: hypothetical protein EA408_13425 [Marinilabiliales bacterium]